MNKVLLFCFLFSSLVSVQAKTDNGDPLVDKLERLSVEKDSLRKVCESLKKDQKLKLDSVSVIVKSRDARIKADSLEASKRLKVVRDSVVALKTSVDQLNNEKSQLAILKINLADRDQKINYLNNTIKQKDESIALEKKNAATLAAQSYDKGKADAGSQLEADYRNSLDDVIGFSTKGSIERDLKIISKSSSVYGKLQHALVYFHAEELLRKKYNQVQVTDAQIKLKTISGSNKVNRLIKLLEDYSSMSDGLSSVIDKINEIDASESVKGMSDNVKKKKYAKIFGSLSEYIFGYDLKAEEYPYIYNIWFQILNRKQSNPDASIKDLQQLLN